MKCLETFFPDLNREEKSQKKENTINHKASAKRRSISSRFFFLFREKNVSLVFPFPTYDFPNKSLCVHTGRRPEGKDFFLSFSFYPESKYDSGVIWQKAVANMKKEKKNLR